MSLAFGAMEPLTLAAAALSHGVLVAAAGVVVVLAILLVFVMVLRGAGSSRRKASGINYDAQQGPVGQPQNPAQAGQWNAGPQGDRFAADQRFDQGGFDQGGYDQGGFDQGFGQGRAPSPQQQGWGQPAQANAAPWGAQDAAADRWNEPMAPAAGQMGGANDWGAPQQQRAASPWDAPAAAGQAGQAAQWNAGGTRPGAGNNGHGANAWDAPAPAQQGWDAPAAPSQPAWGGQPAAPSQPAWGGQPAAPSQPAWGGQPAAPSQPAWGGQPAAPSQPAWGGQPAAPSQPAWGGQPAAQNGGGWGAQADQGMMQPTTPRGGSSPRLVERKNDGAGREFDLRKERLTIGRHRESDVFLEDLAVSRLHTTVSHDASGRYIVRDENSANGTFVNGQRITEQQLKDGDEVQVGQTVLVFHQ